jgi:hypothetical protein
MLIIIGGGTEVACKVYYSWGIDTREGLLDILRSKEISTLIVPRN